MTQKTENSGGSCDYYRVPIERPITESQVPYIAECYDIMDALNMTYAEANIFKEIWRGASARELGKGKEGNTAKRGADKVSYFARCHAIKHGAK